MIAYPPLAIRQDWAPGYLAIRKGAINRDFAFWYPDGQGMPAANGRRYHGAVDHFAPGGQIVRSPIAGAVVRADPSRGNTGQVFGGVLTIQEPSGLAFVCRHVNPTVRVGSHVNAGDAVAAVTDWEDGGDHLHLEVFHNLIGNWYRHANAINPETIEWDLLLGGEEPLPEPPDGDTLRVAIQLPSSAGSAFAGWTEVGNVFKNWITTDGPRSTSRVALAWRGTVRRYDPADPLAVVITHPDGSVQRTTSSRGGHKILHLVAETLVNRYL